MATERVDDDGMLAIPLRAYHGTFMARTFAQINRQIEALKQQAEAQKKKESGSVIARIREAIAFYGLTAQDLGLSAETHTAVVEKPRPDRAAPTRKSAAAGKRAAVGRKKPSSKRPSMVRFQDDQGHRWSGMGRKPGWLVDGLKAGKTLDDFAVKADRPAGDDAPPAA